MINLWWKKNRVRKDEEIRNVKIGDGIVVGEVKSEVENIEILIDEGRCDRFRDKDIKGIDVKEKNDMWKRIWVILGNRFKSRVLKKFEMEERDKGLSWDVVIEMEKEKLIMMEMGVKIDMVKERSKEDLIDEEIKIGSEEIR